MPRMLLKDASPEVYRGIIGTAGAIHEGPLDRTVQELIKLRASQLNGCAFCVDTHSRDARRNGEREERLHHLTVWRESPLYTGAERAALDYTETATRREPVTDEMWETLRKHFPDDREAGDLVGLVAIINALNLIGVPLHYHEQIRA